MDKPMKYFYAFSHYRPEDEVLNNTQEYLKKNGERIESIILEQLEHNLDDAKCIGMITDEMIKRYMSFTKGGKRLRGNFVRLGFLAYGGEDETIALRVGSVMEMIHACLLIHDDIMDQDPLRRNRPTMHEQFREFFIESIDGGAPEDEARHFGESMAINTGDMGVFIAFEMLCDAGLQPPHLVAGIRRLSNFLKNTAYGQALDIFHKDIDKVKEQDILDIYHYKTSQYTITGPMQLGALLAGAEEQSVGPIEVYGKPAGIAFQLRDDLLGLFGKTDEFGKPIGSDLREGKMTLPVLKAYELGDESQRGEIKDILGEPVETMGNDHVERVCEILKQTGAIAYCDELAKGCVEEAVAAIPAIVEPDSDIGLKLRDIAEYLITRTI